jgi:gas vesicle protein
MQQWWNRNEKLIPNGYTEEEVKAFKSKVEDLTGSIPLLLKECVMNEKIDLSADALKNVAKQVRTFMRRIKDNANANTTHWDT